MAKDSEIISIWNGTTDDGWYKNCEYELTIKTAEHLASFAEKVNAGTNFSGQVVKLNANIMLNDITNWQDWANSKPANEWIPIGTPTNPFSGTFNGNGFIVSGVYINNSEDDHKGLFGVVNNNATIKNLGIVTSYIKGKNHTGGLIGDNDGDVSNCYSIVIVTGQENVGWLVGCNQGNIDNSHSIGIITGIKNEISEFVGLNRGSLRNNYYSKINKQNL